MISQTAFYIIYAIGIIWFAIAAIYSYQAAIRDFINLAREGKQKQDRQDNDTE